MQKTDARHTDWVKELDYVEAETQYQLPRAEAHPRYKLVSTNV